MDHAEAAGDVSIYVLVPTSSSYSIVILVIYVRGVVQEKGPRYAARTYIHHLYSWLFSIFS